MSRPERATSPSEVLATRFLKNTFDNGVNAPIEYAGTNSQNGNTAGLIPSTPDWRYTATVGSDNGLPAVTLPHGASSDGVYSNAYIECSSGLPYVDRTQSDYQRQSCSWRDLLRYQRELPVLIRV